MADDLRLVRVTFRHVGYVWATPDEVSRAVTGRPHPHFPGVTVGDGDALLALAARVVDKAEDYPTAEVVQGDEDGWVGVEDWHDVPAHPAATDRENNRG